MPSCDGVLADHLVAREAGQLHERVVDVQVRAVGQARDGDRLRIEVEDRLEPALGRAQRLLGLAAIVDVERRGHPARDDAVLVADGHHPREVKAIGALPVPDPVLDLARARRRERLAEAPLQLRPDRRDGRRRARPCRERLLLAQAGQLHPAIVHPLEAPLGVAGPDDLGQRVRELAIFGLACGRPGHRHDAISSVNDIFLRRSHPADTGASPSDQRASKQIAARLDGERVRQQPRARRTRRRADAHHGRGAAARARR